LALKDDLIKELELLIAEDQRLDDLVPDGKYGYASVFDL
jgi:hypothetical protein